MKERERFEWLLCYPYGKITVPLEKREIEKKNRKEVHHAAYLQKSDDKRY